MSKIFEKRVEYKPFEYPQIMDFVKIINKTFWVHEELNFDADIQDYKAELTETERSIIERALLSIAQLEVNVGSFWNHLYNILPKPEFNVLGSTIAENEARHAEAYSRLLEVLGLNHLFEQVRTEKRLNTKISDVDEVTFGESKNKKEDFLKVFFITLLVENLTLFSQFSNILSFTRFKGIMKNVANVVQWTAQDENVHIAAGVEIVKLMKSEGLKLPHQDVFKPVVEKYIQKECEFLDWIYENGENPYFSRKDLEVLLRYRVDDVLVRVGEKPIYNVDKEYNMQWFDEEIYSDTMDDFFAKRPVDYTKNDKPITGEDLF